MLFFRNFETFSIFNTWLLTFAIKYYLTKTRIYPQYLPKIKRWIKSCWRFIIEREDYINKVNPEIMYNQYWGIRVNSFQVNLLRNPSEFIEESKWIHSGILVNSFWNPVNSLRNPCEFIEESKWIYWGIQVNSFQVNLLRNPSEFILSEFIEESEWIYWGIWVNLLRNPSEFIEESEWIYLGIWENLLRNLSEFMEES